ncbi:MAG: trehalose-phosphatase [Bacteroidia bacterium]|nr:MAG: trehalose-phosphatase [Bacteroidia bacterium]
MEQNGYLTASDIDALIFDLDGVITQTRRVHKKAWKALFDGFLKSKGKDDSMTDRDYDDYVDGKPRYEGVRSFLKSRGVELPFGDTGDEPGYDTVCALGNKKNELFHDVIGEDGVDLYEPAVEKLKQWRAAGVKTAIVSSSKNCKFIIEQAVIDHLFDVRVDGMVSEERGLKGKPNPDIFLEAASELGARPERCIVFEDAISGVKAGQEGFFGLVVGVARFDNKDELLKHGADICIENFEAFDLFRSEEIAGYFQFTKPMVFSEDARVFELLSEKKPVFFLDYDGTLTPIVQRPEDAAISDEMRETLSELGRHFTVAVVTGRDKEDVMDFIRLDHLIYSGSHGYITSGPDGLFMEHEQSEEIIKKLDAVEEDLEKMLEGKAEGAQIDRKRYAIALHYRNAAEEDVPDVFEVVDRILEKYDSLKTGEGKMVVEIKPDIDWHKGKAVLWILEALGLDKKPDLLPVFIGDDVTDEDAFIAIKDIGIGILVENKGQDTAAAYSLKNVFQVRKFFEQLIRLYGE